MQRCRHWRSVKCCVQLNYVKNLSQSHTQNHTDTHTWYIQTHMVHTHTHTHTHTQHTHKPIHAHIQTHSTFNILHTSSIQVKLDLRPATPLSLAAKNNKNKNKIKSAPVPSPTEAHNDKNRSSWGNPPHISNILPDAAQIVHSPLQVFF